MLTWFGLFRQVVLSFHSNKDLSEDHIAYLSKDLVNVGEKSVYLTQ